MAGAMTELQVGKGVPDVDVPLLGRAFKVTQQLLRSNSISAGHDVSDGGIITTLLEMAFAGNCGLAVRPLAASWAVQPACLSPLISAAGLPSSEPHSLRERKCCPLIPASFLAAIHHYRICRQGCEPSTCRDAMPLSDHPLQSL